MVKRTLQIPFDEAEVELIRANAAAEGKSVHDFVHDTLLAAVSARSGRRQAELEHVLRASAEINRRLGQ